MPAEVDITAEIVKQAPALAANIIVVIMFLRTIERMAAEWRELVSEWRIFMESMRKAQSDDNNRVVAEIGRQSELISVLSREAMSHDTFVRQAFSNAMAEMRENARKRRATDKQEVKQ